MKPGWTRRRAGAISLAIAVVGLVTVHVLQHFGIGHPIAMRIVSACFEAGTVGALADWFAVTAIFRRIPIPVIGRHTNLLVKHRRKFTTGIVDVVQNRWLAPSVVRERLQSISAANLIVGYLGDPVSRGRTVSVLRGFLARVNDELDTPEVVGFLDRLLKDQLRDVDIARPLGAWMLDALERGDQAPLWDTLLASAETSLREGALKGVIESTLEAAVRDYAGEDWKKKFLVKGATAIGAIDYGVAADKAIGALSQSLAEARGAPDHPLRRRLEGVLAEFARELRDGRGEATRVVTTFQRSFVDNADAHELIRGILTRLKRTLAEQLSREDSDLAATLDHLLSGVVNDLREHAETREKLDAWMRQVVAELVERHHGVIGEMVESSMTRLTDAELTQQVEDKVGDDLQMIRVNGAVIGAIVGGLLAAAKIVLGE